MKAAALVVTHLLEIKVLHHQHTILHCKIMRQVSQGLLFVASVNIVMLVLVQLRMDVVAR